MNPTMNLMVPLTASAATMLACIALFFSVKRENAAIKRRAQLERESFTASLENLRRALGRLEAGQAERDEPITFSMPMTVPGESINIGKRSQALRLFRRGETPEKIATALKIPQNEVELLVKVHRTVVGQL
ncbi:MAG: hypothetical protein HY821_15065 [Acidobacteria bacterium]|nr:hypothetical protein [Acidobacteriota bacterium]